MANIIADVVIDALANAFTSLVTNTVGSLIGQLFASNESDVFDESLVRGLSATADADMPQSHYDMPINIIYGKGRITGNLIWASPIVRKQITVKVEVNVSEIDVARYPWQEDESELLLTRDVDVNVDRDFTNFAIMLCEGPISSVNKVWFNHELIYDSEKWGDARLRYKSAQVDFDIHNGSEDQAPSAIIQGFDGVDNTPGYRGRAYLVFKSVDITLLGGRVPIVQVEVSGIRSGYQVAAFTDYPASENLGESFEETVFSLTDKMEKTVTVDDFYTDTGDIKPMQFESVADRLPLFVIINDMIRRTGMPEKYFNSTQLSRKITGYTVNNKQPVRTDINTLLGAVTAVISDQGPEIVFKQQPQFLSKQTDKQNCLINEFGLVANSLHDIEGRDGYFSSSSGTSEGQFTAISAFCLAYQATGNTDWKVRAEFVADALEPYLYGNPVPSVAQTYIPHWLFNVKRPIQTETTILSYATKVTDLGATLKAVIPEGAYGMYAEKIKRIDRAYRQSAIFLWENPESQILNFSYLPVKRKTQIILTKYHKKISLYNFIGSIFNIIIPHNLIPWDKTETKVINTTGYTKKLQLQSAELTVTDAYYQSGTGYIVNIEKPSDYTAEIDHTINLAFTLTEVGEWISVGEKYEAWPAWRKLEDGELDAAADSFYWASDAYTLLHQMTGEQKWLDAFAANQHTIVETHDIDDARDVVRPHPSLSAYSLGGSFSLSERSGFTRNSWSRRRSDGFIIAKIPQGEGEVNFGRGVNDSWRTVTDTMQLTIAATGSPSEFYIWIDTDLVFSESTRYYAKITGTNSTIQSFEFNNTEFITIFDALDPEKTLLPGDPIKAVGISLFSQGACNIVLERIRPLPILPLPYTPYAPVYTVNVLNGIVVDWRGSPGPGYAFPHVWHDIGLDNGMRVQTAFIKEAQYQYQNQLSATIGPFIHAYYWDRADNVVYGTPGTWGFNWVDPNSQWAGYQYRCLQSTALAALNTSDPDAILVSSNFISWLHNTWTDHTKFPPTDFPGGLPVWQSNTKYKRGGYNAEIDVIRPTVSNGLVYMPKGDGVSGSTQPVFPTVLYAEVTDGSIIWECTGYQYKEAYGNYNEPHMVSLFMRAALYCSLANINKVKANALLKRGYDYLEANYQGSGEMAGSWSSNGDWWLFWHAEIIITLSKILIDGGALISPLGMSSTIITAWIDESNEFLDRYTRKV